jgi:hypothetical protein
VEHTLGTAAVNDVIAVYSLVADFGGVVTVCPTAGNDSTAFDQTCEVSVSPVHLLQDFEMLTDLLKICSCFF